MNARLFNHEVNEALDILRAWQSDAARMDRPDLLFILNTLQRDIEEQAQQGALDPSTLRKTLYFLSVLMKSRPQSQRRFARMLKTRDADNAPRAKGSRLELVHPE